MKFKLFGIIIFVIMFSNVLSAQYVLSYPYLIVESYSSDYFIGSRYFTIPRAGDSYTSVRLRSMSDGFSGLIRDSYSDYFRNPANTLSDKNELYGDLGSVNDGGKFFFGSAFNLEKSSLGAFVGLDNLNTNKTQQKNTQNYSSSISTSTNVNEESPHQYQANISFAKPISDEKTIALRYHLTTMDNAKRSESSSTSTSTSSNNSSVRISDYSTKGYIHSFDIGMNSLGEQSELDVRIRGLYSSHDLTNSSDYTRNNFSGSYSYRAFNRMFVPNTIKSKAIFLLTGYGTGSNEETYRKYVAELGYTSYELTGTTDGYDSSSSQERQTEVRTTDGSIVDLKVGYGSEHVVSESFKIFFAPSVTYIHHSSEKNESRNAVYQNGTTIDKSTSSSSSSIKKDAYALRLPTGIEYLLNDFMILRGGIEPMYMKGKRTTSSAMNTTSYYSSYYQSDYENETDGLSFKANAGVTFLHQNYGELNIMLGNALTSMNYWLFSMRYWL